MGVVLNALCSNLPGAVLFNAGCNKKKRKKRAIPRTMALHHIHPALITIKSDRIAQIHSL